MRTAVALPPTRHLLNDYRPAVSVLVLDVDEFLTLAGVGQLMPLKPSLSDTVKVDVTIEVPDEAIKRAVLRLAFVDPDERTRQKAAENLLDEVHLSETWRTTDGTDAAAVAVELADELAATDGFGDRTATTIAERETVKAVLGDALDT